MNSFARTANSDSITKARLQLTLLGSFLFSSSLIFLFSPPTFSSTALTAWFALSYILFMMGYSVLNIPFTAMLMSAPHSLSSSIRYVKIRNLKISLLQTINIQRWSRWGWICSRKNKWNATSGKNAIFNGNAWNGWSFMSFSYCWYSSEEFFIIFL